MACCNPFVVIIFIYSEEKKGPKVLMACTNIKTYIKIKKIKRKKERKKEES